MKPGNGFGQYTQLNVLLFLFLMGLGGADVASAEDQTNVPPTIISPSVISLCEWHMTHRFAKETVRAAYDYIGITTEFVERPCRRSLIEASAGAYDGEVARIAGTDKNFPSLIAMDNPTVTIQGVVITTSIDHPIKKWSDLAGLRIGIIRGELYAEKGTVELEPTVVGSYHQLMSLLTKGHLEVGVVIKRDFDVLINAPQFVGRGIHIIGKPVFFAPLYHLVHEKNRDIVPELNAVFKKMWESGEAESIHRKTMLRLISQITGKSS